MNQLLNLTKKNLLLLVRAKSSALIVFLAPLMIILILGLAYNTSAQYGINIGIYSSSFTPDVEKLISSLQEQEFKIIKYNTSINECIDDIKAGVVHTCVQVPENLKLEDNTPKEITFYLDPSKVNLVWMVQQTLQNKFNLQSQEISKELAQNILTKLTDTKTKLGEQITAITDTKSKSNAAYSSSENVKSSISGIDLAPPATSYDPNLINNFKENVSSGINNAQTKINSALTKVDSFNLTSSDKSSLKTLLNEAGSNLGQINAQINSSENTTNNLAQISTLISNLNSELDTTKNKLTTASSTLSSTNNNVETIKSTLTEISNSLNSIQTVLTTSQTNLENKITEAGTISTPLITKIERISPKNTYLNYTFPSLLILVIMFSSLLLGTTLVMMEKHSPAFFRNTLIPVEKITFVFSIYMTNLVLILIQIFVILGVSLFFLKESLPLFPLIALILFFSASVFTFLGMSIGYLFTSEETGALAAISSGSLMLFLSGVILPLESVSPLMRDITSYNPFVISEKLIREVFIYNSSLSMIWTDLALLAGYAIILFLIILIIESVFHQHLLQDYIQKHRPTSTQREKQNEFK